MKKKHIFLIFGYLCCFIPGYAQNKGSTVLLPHEVFVGDTAELRYTFRTSRNLEEWFSESVSSIKLETDGIQQAAEGSCTVNTAVLQKAGTDYVLDIVLVPWQTGSIDFKPFDLAQLVPQKNQSGSPLMVDMEPFTISSIVEKTGAVQLQPSLPPLVVPGTTYAVYGIAIAAVILLILLLRIFTDWQGVCSKWQRLRTLCRNRKNARMSRKRIRILLKTFESDGGDAVSFCAGIQGVLRGYLECRFGYPFSSAVTTQIQQIFDGIFSEMLSDKQSDCIEKIVRIFIRTDYIRYGHDKLCMKYHEPESIARDAVEIIDFFEDRKRREAER